MRNCGVPLPLSFSANPQHQVSCSVNVPGPEDIAGKLAAATAARAKLDGAKPRSYERPGLERAVREHERAYGKAVAMRRAADEHPTFSASGATRKIVLFWLVHPEERIVSTAEVPPQQGLMTRVQAEERRAALMRERSLVEREVTEIFERTITREYNFCEH